LTNVWCVRAEFGHYAEDFLRGGYAAIGWLKDTTLAQITSRDQLKQLYRDYHPDEESNVVIGQQVGQIARFLMEIEEGDTIITPDRNTEILHYGVVKGGYYFEEKLDNCPYPHRRTVEWNKNPLLRPTLSVPLQNTMRSSLTVYSVSQVEEILRQTGRGHLAPTPVQKAYDAEQTVLKQVLNLTDKEFEFLVVDLLAALGFDAEQVGGVGDGGVDAKGILNISGVASVKVIAQAKRYKTTSRISAKTVREFRSAIPRDAQGVFITTSDFQKKAFDIARDPDFPRIGLIDGSQFVDLLVEHWDSIGVDFRDKLGLKKGLVLE